MLCHFLILLFSHFFTHSFTLRFHAFSLFRFFDLSFYDFYTLFSALIFCLLFPFFHTFPIILVLPFLLFRSRIFHAFFHFCLSTFFLLICFTIFLLAHFHFTLWFYYSLISFNFSPFRFIILFNTFFFLTLSFLHYSVLSSHLVFSFSCLFILLLSRFVRFL